MTTHFGMLRTLCPGCGVWHSAFKYACVELCRACWLGDNNDTLLHALNKRREFNSAKLDTESTFV
jgi:hypothetical protein